MKYIRIFLLHFEDAFQSRARSFVWFLTACLNPLIVLLFWLGASKENSSLLGDWSISGIVSYYLLLIIASALLMAHVEESIAEYDIHEGGLSVYLLRPFSYLVIKFFEELPYRIIQGVFGFIVLVLFSLFFSNLIIIPATLQGIILALSIVVLALILSFLFKVIVGLSAFWFTDSFGFQQLVGVAILVFAGYIVPLEFLPSVIRSLSFALPFSYMIYFPISAFQGALSVSSLLKICGIQIMWIAVFAFVYKKLWRSGIKEFTGVGL